MVKRNKVVRGKKRATKVGKDEDAVETKKSKKGGEALVPLELKEVLVSPGTGNVTARLEPVGKVVVQVPTKVTDGKGKVAILGLDGIDGILKNFKNGSSFAGKPASDEDEDEEELDLEDDSDEDDEEDEKPVKKTNSKKPGKKSKVVEEDEDEDEEDESDDEEDEDEEETPKKGKKDAKKKSKKKDSDEDFDLEDLLDEDEDE